MLKEMFNRFDPEEDELLYSYLCRLADANALPGPEHLLEKFYGLSGLSEKRLLRYDALTFLGTLSEDTELLYKGTLLPGISPAVTSKQINRMVGIMSFSRELQALTPPVTRLIRTLKMCPSCVRERGRMLYLREHQMPGVTVCSRHKCRLWAYAARKGKELVGPWQMMETDQDPDQAVAYAGFCVDLLKADIAVNVRAIRPDGHHHGIEDNLKWMAATFGSVKKMQESINIDEQSPLPGVVEAWGVLRKAKCPEGHVYTTTSDRMRSGWGCPVCDRLIGPEKTFRNVVGVTAADYELLSDFERMEAQITVRHAACGKTLSMKARKFVEEGVRCTCRTAQVNQRVSTAGDHSFTLREYRGFDANAVFYHQRCGRTFQKSYRWFISYPLCPLCSAEKKKKQPEKKAYKHMATYRQLCDRHIPGELVFLADIVIPGRSHAQTNNDLRALRQKGLLDLVFPGVYRFPGEQPVTGGYFYQKYVSRAGKRMGFVKGQSFAHLIGLAPAPEIVCIATNAASRMQGKLVYISAIGARARIYGLPKAVDHTNADILALLDFGKYAQMYPEEDLAPALLAYITDRKISPSMIRAEADTFPSWWSDWILQLMEEHEQKDFRGDEKETRTGAWPRPGI